MGTINDLGEAKTLFSLTWVLCSALFDLNRDLLYFFDSFSNPLLDGEDASEPTFNNTFQNDTVVFERNFKSIVYDFSSSTVMVKYYLFLLILGYNAQYWTRKLPNCSNIWKGSKRAPEYFI